MKTDKAYYVGIHRYSHKSGIAAEIIGVGMITHDNISEPRLCYKIQWYDGVEDWVPVSDSDNYKIISFQDVLSGNIPKVTN
jgi:hypothetical protein